MQTMTRCHALDVFMLYFLDSLETESQSKDKGHQNIDYIPAGRGLLYLTVVMPCLNDPDNTSRLSFWSDAVSGQTPLDPEHWKVTSVKYY